MDHAWGICIHHSTPKTPSAPLKHKPSCALRTHGSTTWAHRSEPLCTPGVPPGAPMHPWSPPWSPHAPLEFSLEPPCTPGSSLFAVIVAGAALLLVLDDASVLEQLRARLRLSEWALQQETGAGEWLHPAASMAASEGRGWHRMKREIIRRLSSTHSARHWAD